MQSAWGDDVLLLRGRAALRGSRTWSEFPSELAFLWKLGP
jgi:hypothetical protein